MVNSISVLVWVYAYLMYTYAVFHYLFSCSIIPLIIVVAIRAKRHMNPEIGAYMSSITKKK